MTSPLPVAGSDTRRIPFARTVISLEAREAALYVLESGWVTTGPLVDEFERAFWASLFAPIRARWRSQRALLSL